MRERLSNLSRDTALDVLDTPSSMEGLSRLRTAFNSSESLAVAQQELGWLISTIETFGAYLTVEVRSACSDTYFSFPSSSLYSPRWYALEPVPVVLGRFLFSEKRQRPGEAHLLPTKSHFTGRSR